MKSDDILGFLESTAFTGPLPDGIAIMNPYRESKDIREICRQFYTRFYSDTRPRKLILGINPGRLGAGATGIPFTDTKRLQEFCGIAVKGLHTHEPSSVFMHEMINAYGGAEKFYSDFYISSVCPLGFVSKNHAGRMVNYNYYDSPALETAVRAFIVENIFRQVEIAGSDLVCFCLGTGKNAKYLKNLNENYHFFNEIVPLEHPRYIMQYKTASKSSYIDQYLQAFTKFL
jgi:hypothetical protein